MDLAGRTGLRARTQLHWPQVVRSSGRTVRPIVFHLGARDAAELDAADLVAALVVGGHHPEVDRLGRICRFPQLRPHFIAVWRSQTRRR